MTWSEEMLSQAALAQMKQREEIEDPINTSELEEVDAQFEINNQHIENHKQDEGDLSDFEDIFEPKRQEDNKEDQDVHLDNLAEFLDGFDDDELENFL